MRVEEAVVEVVAVGVAAGVVSPSLIPMIQYNADHLFVRRWSRASLNSDPGVVLNSVNPYDRVLGDRFRTQICNCKTSFGEWGDVLQYMVEFIGDTRGTRSVWRL